MHIVNQRGRNSFCRIRNEGFSKAIFLIVIFSFLFVLNLSGQTASSPSAKLSLATTFRTLGWFQPANPGPLDLLATGTVEYKSPTGQSVGTYGITIKFRGREHYRIDIADPSGTKTTIGNGFGGTTIVNGKTEGIPAASTISALGPLFPFLLEELDPTNSQTAVADVGLANAAPNTLQRLRVQLPQSRDFEVGIRGRSFEKTVSISVNGTVSRIEFFRVASDNHYARVPFTMLFSDFRLVSGIAVPFRQEEQLAGRTMRIFTFQSVTIGPAAGITDSDFRVATSTVSGGAQ